MTPEEFVNALREIVLTRAVDSTLSSIESASGRRPRRELVEANAWYQGLSDEDRAQLLLGAVTSEEEPTEVLGDIGEALLEGGL